MKDDSVYLRHILEAIRRTMAEATQRLSDAARAARPEVDWRALSGFRNVLVHNYPGIDLEQIWMVVHRDVPQLKSAATALASH